MARGEAGRRTRRASAAYKGLLACCLLAATLPAAAGAEGVSGYMEYTLSRTVTDAKDATGTESRTETGGILQRYNLSLDRRVYPHLRFLGGGLFEKSVSDGFVQTGPTREEFDTVTTKVRPFVDLELSTAPYQAGVSYSLSQERQTTKSGATQLLVRELLSGTLGWTPDGFPSLRFQFQQSDNHDGARVLQDVLTRTYQLTSQYRPASSTLLYYQGNLTDMEDKRNTVESRDATHNGRFSYSGQLWNRRIALGSDYHVTVRDTETRAGGTGEVAVAVLPQAGLSAIDDTPEEGALTPNPALVDGDVTAGSGINLGLPPPGGDSRRRNVGLDFGTPRLVNTLYVQVDRELSAAVADSFSWDVYSSADNLNWTFRQTVFPAAQDPFLPRFEIRFPDVTARYVKLAVRPLAPTAPLATDYPSIQVTELSAAERTAAASAGGRSSSVFHVYNFYARTRILSAPALAHELTWSYAKATGAFPRYTLSNGLSASGILSRNVSASGRVAREDGAEDDRKRTAWLFSGSVQATPLPTLRHNLLLSGRTETIEERTNRSLSLFLYNTAAPYRGIDLNAAFGSSRTVNETGQKTETVQADAGAVLVPNRKVTLGLSWSDKRDRISGGEASGERTVNTRSAEADLSVYPVSAVYLFGSWRVEDPADLPRRTIRNYSASWTPFPDGRLHLGVLYSETLRTDTDGRDRTITPSLRVDLARGSFVSLLYQKTSSRDNLQSSDSDVVSGTLRIAF